MSGRDRAARDERVINGRPTDTAGVRPRYRWAWDKYLDACANHWMPQEISGADNPFPWMSELIDLKKEKNFFETRVTEYRTRGTLEWE